MLTTITRSDYPHLWSCFALVAATMGQVGSDVVTDVAQSEVEDYEIEIGTWSLTYVMVLAGVVDDDFAFDRAVATEVGSFVNHVLSMPA